MRNKDGRNRGLTLIELLVVFTIIGMLTAMLFPVFATARKRGMQTSCLSNLRQAGTAAQLYMADHDSLLPRNPWRLPVLGTGPRLASDGSGLEAYGLTNAISSCPGGGLDSGYQWRFEIPVIHDRPTVGHRGYTIRDSDYHRIRPESMSVLAYCYRHLTRGYTVQPNRATYDYQNREGNYNVLRADGSASFIPAGEVRIWSHTWRNGKDIWYPPEQAKEAHKHRSESFDVFPNEPWPPQLVDEKKP